MSPKLRAHGSELHGPPKPRWPITSDLRQEPGALAAHAGICAGGERGNLPPYRDTSDHPVANLKVWGPRIAKGMPDSLELSSDAQGRGTHSVAEHSLRMDMRKKGH